MPFHDLAVNCVCITFNEIGTIKPSTKNSKKLLLPILQKWLPFSASLIVMKWLHTGNSMIQYSWNMRKFCVNSNKQNLDCLTWIIHINLNKHIILPILCYCSSAIAEKAAATVNAIYKLEYALSFLLFLAIIAFKYCPLGY